jgi:O-antigen/teichoic acid export membrane protein
MGAHARDCGGHPECAGKEDSCVIERPVKLAGKALIWQSIQMGGVKIIFMLRILILARLLTPDDFGLVTIATSSMGLLLGLTNLGILPALVQGQDTGEDHYDAAWTIGLIRAIFIAVILLTAAPFIATMFAEPRAIPIIRVFAVIPIIEALTSIKVAALNRNLLFRPLAFLRLIDASIHAIISIALAQAFGVWALVVGMVAGSTATFVFSYFIAPYRPRLSLNSAAARSIIRFGRWIFVSGLIALLAGNVMRIVISRQLGTTGLGLYYLATQLAFLPAEIASETFGNVAFPLFSRLKNDIAQATRVFGALFTSMAALLYPVCAFLIVFAPAITREVFGPSWAGTEQVIQVLALVTMVGIFGEATGPVLKGFGHPYKNSFIELIQSLLIISFVWLFTSRFGLVGAALAWLPAITVSQFISARFIQRVLDRPFMGLHRPVLAILSITLISALIALTVSSLFPSFLGLVIAGVLFLGSVMSLLWFTDRRFSLGFMKNMASAFPQMASLLGVSYVEN